MGGEEADAEVVGLGSVSVLGDDPPNTYLVIGFYFHEEEDERVYAISYDDAMNLFVGLKRLLPVLHGQKHLKIKESYDRLVEEN